MDRQKKKKKAFRSHETLDRQTQTKDVFNQFPGKSLVKSPLNDFPIFSTSQLSLGECWTGEQTEKEKRKETFCIVRRTFCIVLYLVKYFAKKVT
jgi:hypothetical protein